MRQGQGNEILSDKSTLIGVNLGADYCAEHEWGITGIKSCFGFGEGDAGLPRRKLGKSNSGLRWLENQSINSSAKKQDLKWSGFYFSLDREVHIRAYAGDNDLVTMWDEKSFCALSSDPKTVAKLREIYEAFSKQDIAMWIGGGGVFKNGGLCIAISSHLPTHITKMWKDKDEDTVKLKAAALATGIETKLRASNKRFHALSPSWDTKNGGVMFWLNPCEQHLNNSGWYKVPDLEAWIEGKGPIPKANKGKR